MRLHARFHRLPNRPARSPAEWTLGYLIPVRDPLALAAGIERALESPIFKEELAEAARPLAGSSSNAISNFSVCPMQTRSRSCGLG